MWNALKVFEGKFLQKIFSTVMIVSASELTMHCMNDVTTSILFSALTRSSFVGPLCHSDGKEVLLEMGI